MKNAKQQASKDPAPQKSLPKGYDVEAFADAFASGKSTLKAERERLGLISNRPLSAALIAAKGQAWYEQVKAGRGVSRLSEHREKAPRSEGEPVVLIDDTGVPRIQSRDIRLVTPESVVTFMRGLIATADERITKARGDHLATTAYKDASLNAHAIVERADAVATYDGWKTESYHTPTGTAIRLFAPDGTSYVRASGREKADVIIVLSDESLGVVRMRKETEAASTRRARREGREQAKRQEAVQ